MADEPTKLPTKRMRAQVSYAELGDDDFEDMIGGNASNSDEGEVTGDNIEYGSRKKKAARKTKKRAKLSQKRPTKQQKPFRFLELPQELRDYIYELALVDPLGVCVGSQLKGHRRAIYRSNRHVIPEQESSQGEVRVTEPEKDQWTALVPNLLAVSKQIRSEASGYLYKQRIGFQTMQDLHTFLSAIGQHNRDLLTHLVIKEWGEGRGVHKAMNVAAFSFLSTCTNIKTLHLDCMIGYYRTPKWLARQLFRDGHYFMEAYGTANGNKDAAIDVLELNKRNFGSAHWDRDSGMRGSGANTEKYVKLFHKELRSLLRSNSNGGDMES